MKQKQINNFPKGTKRPCLPLIFFSKRKGLLLKILLVAAVVLVSGIYFSYFKISIVNAASEQIQKITSSSDGSFWVSAFSYIMQAAGELAAYIIGIFVMLAVWLVQIALSINQELYTSPVVTNGIKITISLANLGFVTLLIIIAISTILRRESYGVKKTLSKLIIAALLVNFSLPIATAILQISDQFTYTFLSNFPGSSGSGLADFASSVGSAFQPQRLTTLISNNENQKAAQTNQPKAMQDLGSSTVKAILGLVFSVLFPLALLISLLGLFVMLLVRYIYLGLLLILMPLAWVTWIAPMTSDLWHEWWNKFLKWTFFSPIMMMFLYIAMASVKALNDAQYKLVEALSDPNLSSAQLGKALGNAGIDTSILASVGDQLILIGLVIGGLIASDRLGIKGASKTMSAATGAGKSLANWTGRKAAGQLTRPLRSSAGQSIIGAMQRNRFLQPLGTAMGNLAQTTGGKADVDAAEKKYANLGKEGFENVGKSMENKRLGADKIGYLQAKEKAGLLTDNDRKYIAENKNEFSRYGASSFANKQAKASIWGDEKVSQAHKNLQSDQEKFKNGQITEDKLNETKEVFRQTVSDRISGASEDDQKEMMKSFKNYLKNYNLEDPSMAGESKESHDAIQEAVSVAISNNPTLYNAAVSKLDGASAANVTQKILNHQIDNLLAKGKISQPEAMGYKNNAIKLGNADDMEALLKKLRASGAEFDETATSILNANIGRRVLGAITGGAHYAATKEPSAAVRKIG